MDSEASPDAYAPAYIIVLDFEATCADRKRDQGFRIDAQEVIELPACIIRVADRMIVDSFDTFVRPTRQPVLTAFCTELTSIEQDDVDAAPLITEAFLAFRAWLNSYGLDHGNAIVATCGNWDLKEMWPRQRRFCPELPDEPLFDRWCNIKRVFQRVTGKKGHGMMHMLSKLEVPHRGHHHRGRDDVENLTRLCLALLERGGQFVATGQRPSPAAHSPEG